MKLKVITLQQGSTKPLNIELYLTKAANDVLQTQMLLSKAF